MSEEFVDLHTHGIGQYDTRTHWPEDILKIAQLHKKSGTGAILPTIYPGKIDKMRRNMEAVKRAMRMQDAGYTMQGKKNPESCIMHRESFIVHLGSESQRHASCILGVHLEGPFLNPLRCGALDKEYFMKPAISSFKKLIEGYEDIIKIITIAPEIPGALKVIEKCTEFGIRVNIGHSDATYKEALDGKKAGASGITHMFNAMRPFHHREPGLAGLGLIDEDLYVEVIADGVHLHPKTLELIFSKKRLDRIILVSDSIKDSKKRGAPVYTKKGILAGSGITIRDSVKVLKSIGIPDAEIIEAAADNPARYISAIQK